MKKNYETPILERIDYNTEEVLLNASGIQDKLDGWNADWEI